MHTFQPDPGQLAAVSRWLRCPEVARQLAELMPLCGGPRSACERRVIDVADALCVLSITVGEATAEEWQAENDMMAAEYDRS